MPKPREAVVSHLADLLGDLGPMQEAVDLPDLFAGLARSIVGSVHADACTVSVLDDNGSKIREVAAHAVDQQLLDPIAKQRRLSDDASVAEIMATRSPLAVSSSDPQADKRLLTEYGFGFVLMCPLVVDGDVVGLIEAYRVVDRPFRGDDPSQISLLSTFAANAYSRILMAHRLESHYMETIEALAAALEARDPETRDHTGRMKDLAIALSDAMKLTRRERRAVKLGSVLHDVGKIGIPDSILSKPGPLTADEWIVMRRHPQIGVEMLRDIEFLNTVLPAVRHHHERWDGTGYPDGLKGEAIPMEARVIAVCDSFDAMTSDRPYRSAMSIPEAIQELRRCSGTQFDPECVELFVRLIEELGIDDLQGRVLRFAS